MTSKFDLLCEQYLGETVLPRAIGTGKRQFSTPTFSEEKGVYVTPEISSVVIDWFLDDKNLSYREILNKPEINTMSREWRSMTKKLIDDKGSVIKGMLEDPTQLQSVFNSIRSFRWAYINGSGDHSFDDKDENANSNVDANGIFPPKESLPAEQEKENENNAKVAARDSQSSDLGIPTTPQRSIFRPAAQLPPR